MTDSHRPRGRVPRRRWLAVSGGALAGALAGCLGGDGSDDDSNDGTDSQSAGGETDGTSDGDDGDDGDGGTSDGDGGDDGDDGDDGEEEPLPVTLTGLTVGDTAADAVPNLVVDTDDPLTATLDSQTEITLPGTLALDIFAVEDVTPWTGESSRAPPGGTPVATAREEFNVEAGTSQSVTVTGLTNQLAGGAYVAVARVPEGETRAVAPLTVTARTEITVDVYAQTAAPENRVDAGELVLATGPVPTAATDDGEGDSGEGAGGDDNEADVTVFETVDLAEQSTPTLSVPLGPDTDVMVLTARSVDGGVYPPASAEVPLDGTDLPDVELVAGYEFQGTDAMRFTDYILFRNEPYRLPRFEEWVMYGTYGANGDYNCYYTRGNLRKEERLIDSDGTPPEYGANLNAIKSNQGHAPPEHDVLIDEEGYYNPGFRWEESESDDDATAYRRTPHVPVLDGLDAVTDSTPEQREFVGTGQYRNREVDIYRVNTDIGPYTLPDSRVFVDPETGYILRIERDPMGEDGQGAESFEVAEYFEHGEPEKADLELIQNRSTNNTEPGLDELPWEQSSVEQ